MKIDKETRERRKIIRNIIDYKLNKTLGEDYRGCIRIDWMKSVTYENNPWFYSPNSLLKLERNMCLYEVNYDQLDQIVTADAESDIKIKQVVNRKNCRVRVDNDEVIKWSRNTLLEKLLEE